ncbi:MAG: macrocin O-methyltransferase [Haliea sp.]|nr:MAG: macrocin O-methyltransferase [Haliea sp.]
MPRDLDIEQLKRELTGTMAVPEPDAQAGDARYLVDFLNHYVKGEALTMVPRVRLDHLQACVEDVLVRGVPGDLMECGVWRGGVTILMRALLKVHGVRDRVVWVADSFQGLPEPDATRFPKEAAAHRSALMRDGFGHFAVGLAAVQGNFARYGLLDGQVRFLPGWFTDTLPGAPIGQLAVLRLDGDYHASTLDCLEHLYDRLAIGGYLIVDDYAEDDWTCCRDAVDGFRLRRGIGEPMVQVDRRCWYWQRTA